MASQPNVLDTDPGRPTEPNSGGGDSSPDECPMPNARPPKRGPCVEFAIGTAAFDRRHAGVPTWKRAGIGDRLGTCGGRVRTRAGSVEP